MCCRVMGLMHIVALDFLAVGATGRIILIFRRGIVSLGVVIVLYAPFYCWLRMIVVRIVLMSFQSIFESCFLISRSWVLFRRYFCTNNIFPTGCSWRFLLYSWRCGEIICAIQNFKIITEHNLKKSKASSITFLTLFTGDKNLKMKISKGVI